MRSHRDSNQDPSVEKYRLIKDGFSQQRRDEAVFTGDGQRTEIPPPISLDRMSLTGVRRLNEFRSTLGNKSSTSEAGKANTNTLDILLQSDMEIHISRHILFVGFPPFPPTYSVFW